MNRTLSISGGTENDLNSSFIRGNMKVVGNSSPFMNEYHLWNSGIPPTGMMDESYKVKSHGN